MGVLILQLLAGGREGGRLTSLSPALKIFHQKNILGRILRQYSRIRRVLNDGLKPGFLEIIAMISKKNPTATIKYNGRIQSRRCDGTEAGPSDFSPKKYFRANPFRTQKFLLFII